MASARKVGSMEFEAGLASLSLAGIKILVQATVTALAGASTGYTVTHKNTRRLLVIHLSGGNADIRVNVGTAATAAHVPVLPARYIPIDAGWDINGVAEVVYFWNTTVGNITVNIVELA